MGDATNHLFPARIDELAKEIRDDVIAWRLDFHRTGRREGRSPRTLQA